MSSWLASSRSLTISASRFDSSVITSSSFASQLCRELDVVAAERQRGAVDRGERRPQLVRHGGDEVLPHRLERALLREVAERVDGAVLVADRGHREPQLAAADLERHALRPAGLAHGGDGQPRLDRLPARDGVADAAPEHVVGGEPGDPLRRRIPEPDAAAAVDERDAVADRGEHAGSLRARLGLPVQPRVLDRARGAARELLREDQLAARRSAVRGRTR